MGALPKQRISRARRGNRRQHQKLKAPHLVTCPNCRELKVSHHVCLSCGFYAGRQVVDIDIRMPTAQDLG